MKRITKFTYKGVKYRVDTSQVRMNFDKESTQWLMKMLAANGCDEHDIKSLLESKRDIDLVQGLFTSLLKQIDESKQRAFAISDHRIRNFICDDEVLGE